MNPFYSFTLCSFTSVFILSSHIRLSPQNHLESLCISPLSFYSRFKLWFLSSDLLLKSGVILCDVRGGWIGTLAGISRSVIVPWLLHTHLSRPPPCAITLTGSTLSYPRCLCRVLHPQPTIWLGTERGIYENSAHCGNRKFPRHSSQSSNQQETISRLLGLLFDCKNGSSTRFRNVSKFVHTREVLQCWSGNCITRCGHLYSWSPTTEYISCKKYKDISPYSRSIPYRNCFPPPPPMHWIFWSVFSITQKVLQ